MWNRKRTGDRKRPKTATARSRCRETRRSWRGVGRSGRHGACRTRPTVTQEARHESHSGVLETMRRLSGMLKDERDKVANADHINRDYGALTELLRAAPDPVNEMERLPAHCRGSSADRRQQDDSDASAGTAEGVSERREAGRRGTRRTASGGSLRCCWVRRARRLGDAAPKKGRRRRTATEMPHEHATRFHRQRDAAAGRTGNAGAWPPATWPAEVHRGGSSPCWA